MNEVYPRPQWLKKTGSVCRFEGPVEVAWVDEGDAKLAENLVEELRVLGVEARIGAGGSAAIVVRPLDDPGGEGMELPEEVRRSGGYALRANPDGIAVAGFDAAGRFYGVQTLLQVLACESGMLTVDEMEVYDWPYKEVRGIHLYMPGQEQIPFFKRLVVWLSRLKCNTLFLEVGGGMEFERHPAINEAWVRFGEILAGFPGGQRGLQRSQSYVKSSVHAELGQGGWLRKGEVAELVSWAAAHHVEIVPEVPTLSHAYYLCMAYPEIAEREDDPYPDTYCPSNPRTYEILFDVLEEVIEVFSPRLIHIGHDEIVHLGHCPRCRGKSGAELLAGDVKRIHGFLAAKGIRTGMWGDKLLPLVTGGRFGGGMAMDESNSYWGRGNQIPATYPALAQIPRDVLISNWYWRIDRAASSVFLREGFEIIFGNFGGNFAAQEFDRWQEESGAGGILGAEVSTWCQVSDFAFGYNGCFFNMLFAAQMLWWSHYRDLDREEVTGEIARQTRLLRRELGIAGSEDWQDAGAVPLPEGEGPSAFSVAEWVQMPEGISFSDEEAKRGLGVGPERDVLEVAVDGNCDGLSFLHGCVTGKERIPSWGLKDTGTFPEEDLLAVYRVCYEDGREEEVPVRFGSDVARWDVPYGERVDAVPFLADPVPVGRDGAGRRITLYCSEWVNPHPRARIARLVLEYRGDEEGGLWLAGIRRLASS